MKKEFVTQAELARVLNVSHQRIYALTKKGILPRRKDKKYDLEKCLEIAQNFRSLNKNVNIISETPKNGKSTPPKDFKDIDISEARRIYEVYRGKLAELEYNETQRQLVPIADVIEFCQKIITITKTRILNIPSKIAPELIGIENPREIKAALETELHEALKELGKMENVGDSMAKSNN